MVHWPLIGGILGVVCIVAGSIFGWVVFPPMVKDQVKESVVLREGTEQYERWRNLPQALDFKVYLFNVLNPEEVQQGGRPRVQEVGPYIYSQYRVKNDVDFADDQDSVSFTQQQRFVFNARASAPLTQDDQITVLNMHVNSILQLTELQVKSTISNIRKNIGNSLDRTPIIRTIKRFLERTTPVQSILQIAEDDLPTLMAVINTQLDMIFGRTDSMFLRTTPREFLFEGIPFCVNAVGLVQIICQQVEQRGTSTIRKIEDGSLRFSFFNHKNTTHDGLYEIATGVSDIQNILAVNKWKNNATLSQWLNPPSGQTSTCNMLNGTDGSALAPFREQSGSAYIFSSDICRSVEIHYEKQITYQGIPGLRYVTKDNFLNEIGPEYGTECFCTNRIPKAIAKPNGCLYRGALDLSSCTAAPVVLTLPHFLGAANEYTSLIDGLTPDVNKHQIHLDVEPNTGSPLSGGKRVQFNMFLRPIDQITITQNLKSSLFPVVWVDEGIQLNDDMVNLLKSGLINVLLILSIVQWLLIGLGVFLIIGCTVWHLYRKRNLTVSNSVEPIFPELKDVKG